MPLDQTNWKQDTETKPDLSKPSLEGLSWLLRHLPANHKWDFNTVGGPRSRGCGSYGCAYGLMFSVWGRSAQPFWKRLGITSHVEESFFLHGRYSVPDEDVTHTMVADRIDAYLAETRK